MAPGASVSSLAHIHPSPRSSLRVRLRVWDSRRVHTMVHAAVGVADVVRLSAKVWTGEASHGRSIPFVGQAPSESEYLSHGLPSSVVLVGQHRVFTFIFTHAVGHYFSPSSIASIQSAVPLTEIQFLVILLDLLLSRTL